MPQDSAAQDRKVRENRLRNMAGRQGLRLIKVRRMDPLALDYGTYRIETLEGGPAPGFGANLTLKEVERLLTTPPGQRLAET